MHFSSSFKSSTLNSAIYGSLKASSKFFCCPCIISDTSDNPSGCNDSENPFVSNSLNFRRRLKLLKELDVIAVNCKKRVWKVKVLCMQINVVGEVLSQPLIGKAKK